MARDPEDDPPEYLDAPARAAFLTAKARTEATLGQWDGGLAMGAEMLAIAASSYLRFAAGGHTPAEVEEYRGLVRDMMTSWYLLHPADVSAKPMRPDGLDADIARLCGLSAVLH